MTCPLTHLYLGPPEGWGWTLSVIPTLWKSQLSVSLWSGLPRPQCFAG